MSDTLILSLILAAPIAGAVGAWTWCFPFNALQHPRKLASTLIDLSLLAFALLFLAAAIMVCP